MSEWTHYALNGTDDWVAGTPLNFGSPNSNAWVTTLNGACALSSIRCLETPDFDLSDLSANKILSFNQKRSGSNCTYQLQYSINGGITWQLLDNATMPRANWQGSSGWTGNAVSQQRSALRLSFLQGNATVRLRFLFSSGINASRGWMIDDFSIQNEYINVTPSQGDTINITPYFTNFTIVNSFFFTNPYQNSTNFRNAFYLSANNSFEYSDTYLGNVNFSTSGNLSNWSNSFALPPGLPAGDYFIITRLDTLNDLQENNETDNISFTVLRLAPPVLTDYLDDFDTDSGRWKKVAYPLHSTWLVGDPDGWHNEDAHTLPNAWFSGEDVPNNSLPQEIESPFLNLTATDDNAICFWYKHSGDSWFIPDFSLSLPDIMTTEIGPPVYLNSANVIPIRLPRRYGWDCYCYDLSAYDNQLSTKFRIRASGNLTPFTISQAVVDDIYIGTKKPDVSIENETPARFTSTQSAVDTLDYILFNSGLQTLPSTVTRFYWSADNILDPADILLSTVNEPAIADTSFLRRSVVITKPVLTPSIFYIIWVTDAADEVAEMRETNNSGAIEIHQENITALPYYNDFESEANGWRHNSTLGNDDWQWSVASGTQIPTAFSGEKAFITNAGGDTVSRHSRSHLYTPVFDLGQLTHPVMEFDLMAMFYHPSANYVYWPFNMGNIMYSTNGGADWITLEPQNKSFRRMYTRIEFSSIGGTDLIPSNSSSAHYGSLLYGKNQPIFRPEYDYQSRNYDDNYHYAVDLSFLQGETVQFMFVYANENSPMEGMLIDNFAIREHLTDLYIPTDKKLLAAAGDRKIRTYFHVRNKEKYIAPETRLGVYCSVDSLLDASDFLVTTRNIDSLGPFEKQLVVINNNAPDNFGSYNYLLCKTDLEDEVAESDEQNNVHVFELAMDSCSQFQYPLHFQFEEEYIDGWSWDHDSTGVYHDHTFRTRRVLVDPVFGSSNGEWFLDPLDQSGFNMPLYLYPTYHIYSPAFDLSGNANVTLSFDILCITSIQLYEGANLSYSIDGGLTWTVMDYSQDPNPVNWYNQVSLSELQGQPGWHFQNDWLSCAYDASFLAGQSNVHFRFTYKGKHRVHYPGPQGFRMDNFRISGASADLATNDNNQVINATPSIPVIDVSYQVTNTSSLTLYPTTTGFYWSTDTILDTGDVFITELDEDPIPPMYSGVSETSLSYPMPVLQNTYYLFHKLDNNLSVNESNEANNSGRTIVQFDMTQVGLKEQSLISGLKRVGDAYELSLEPDQQVNLQFLTLQGQVLCSADTETTGGAGLIRIEPGALASGAYLIRATIDGDSFIVRIFHY